MLLSVNNQQSSKLLQLPSTATATATPKTSKMPSKTIKLSLMKMKSSSSIPSTTTTTKTITSKTASKSSASTNSDNKNDHQQQQSMIIDRQQSNFNKISDYLCEELLMYLPPEDKLRLESVSKQFQRTIFRQQHRLILKPPSSSSSSSLLLVDLNNNNEWNYLKNQLIIRYYDGNMVKHKINIKLFRKICRKFQYISDIQIHYHLDQQNMDQLFCCIIENLNQIKRVDIINFFNLSKDILDLFGQKFGHQLRAVKSNYISTTNLLAINDNEDNDEQEPNDENNDDNQQQPLSSSLLSTNQISESTFTLLKYCTNLVSINGTELLNDKLIENINHQQSSGSNSGALIDNNNNPLNSEDSNEYTMNNTTTTTPANNDIIMPKLKSCNIKIQNKDNVNQLEKFSNIYMNNLEKINLEMVDYIAQHHYIVNFIFPFGISKFLNLRELIITLKYNGLNGNDNDNYLWIKNGLNLISIECKKIEHLGIDFIGYQNQCINNVIQSLQSFKNLSKLSLSVSMYNKDLQFPLMSQLKQLNLSYPRLYQYTNLKQLINCFPNIQELYLNNMYFFNDILLNSLIGMKSLRLLHVCGLNCTPQITTNGLKIFLNTATTVTKIKFDKLSKQIDCKTLEMLIDFVRKNNQNYYEFDLSLNEIYNDIYNDNIIINGDHHNNSSNNNNNNNHLNVNNTNMLNNLSKSLSANIPMINDNNYKRCKDFEQFFNRVQLPKNLSIK